MRRWISLVWLLASILTAIAAAPAQAAPRIPRIAFVSIHLAVLPNQARTAARRVEGRVAVDLYGLGDGLLPGIADVDLAAYDLVLVDGAAPRLINFKPQFDAARARSRLMVLDGETWIKGNVAPSVLPQAELYWKNATTENFARLFDYLRVAVLDGTGAVQPPVVYPALAFYHPDAPQPFADRAAYDRWAQGRDPAAAARPRIGLVFYRSVVLGENAAVIDSLIREIDRQGGEPVALWREGSADPLASTFGNAGLDALILCANQINYADHVAGAAEAAAIGVPVLNCYSAYNQTPAEWAKAPGGFAPDQTGELSMGETEGIVEPMTVGGRLPMADGQAINTPIPGQVEWRVARAMAWARLHRMANHDKRLVIPYFSEEGGKGNVGSDPDTYLDAQASLAALLRRLQAEGYDVGDAPLPDGEALAQRMAESGSNVGVWAPGELDKRVAAGEVALIPEAEYLKWWARAPAAGRRQVEATWGAPPGKLMVHADAQGRRAFVVPLLRFGKVALAPHPTWGYLQNDKALAAAGAMPPHHQYIAFYAWMRQVWKADAYVSLFSQLALMPGKQEGPARDDWVGWLIGDVPHIQPTPLSANGGIGNKRRTQATTVGFMPGLAQMGLPPELAALKRQLAAAGDDGPARDALRTEVARLQLAKALDFDPAAAPWSDLERALGAYLDELERAVAPHGGHVLGEAPALAVQAGMIRAMLAGDGGDPPPAVETVRAVLDGAAPADLAPARLERIRDYAGRIQAAGGEMDGLIDALSGRYVEPGPNQDAVRNPDALPGGRNPYTLDTRILPTKAAWETGSRLADEMIADYRRKHGRYPRKTAFVLWSSESVVHQGVMESQILRLIGARPVWNPRGQVVDVALDPAATLGRPRVDVMVTTSGTYRDHFGDKINLLAKAVRLAAAADEPDNAVRAAVQATERTLLARGIAPDEARARGLRRIFSTAPGAYSPSTQFAIKAGPQWDDAKLSGLYGDRMSHAYGDGQDGVADADAFLANLDTVDASVFSRSSNVLGLLETPMPAAYFGGLSMAVRERTGTAVESYVADLSQPSAGKLETLDRAFRKELSSRYLNPEWIKAMQAGGYNGARYMAEFADNMLLWDVTTPALVTDKDWADAKSVLVDDRYGLGLKAYFDKANPYALQQMVGAMLEAVRRGRWQADAATRAALQATLQDSIARHGPACDRATCDPALSGAAAAPALGARPAAPSAGPRPAPAAVTAAPPARPSAPTVSGFELAEAPPARPSAPAPNPGPLYGLMLLIAAALFGLGLSRRPTW